MTLADDFYLVFRFFRLLCDAIRLYRGVRGSFEVFWNRLGDAFEHGNVFIVCSDRKKITIFTKKESLNLIGLQFCMCRASRQRGSKEPRKRDIP